jgi:hypothetical protein
VKNHILGLEVPYRYGSETSLSVDRRHDNRRVSRRGSTGFEITDRDLKPQGDAVRGRDRSERQFELVTVRDEFRLPS